MTARSFVLLFVLLSAACDKPVCRNTNQVIAANVPNSPAYNEELVQLLRRAPGARFWIEGFTVAANRSYVICEVQAAQLCATLWLDVTDADDAVINPVKARKGVSYHGACFRGLTFTTMKDSNYHFRYNGAKGIDD